MRRPLGSQKAKCKSANSGCRKRIYPFQWIQNQNEPFEVNCIIHFLGLDARPRNLKSWNENQEVQTPKQGTKLAASIFMAFFLFYPAKAAQFPDLCMRDGDRRTDIVACPLMENPHRISATFDLEFWTPHPLSGTEVLNLCSFCLLFGYPQPQPTTVVVTYGVGTSLQSQPSSRQSSHHHPFYEGASLLPHPFSGAFSAFCLHSTI